MAPSGIIKACPQGGGFQRVSCSGPLGSGSEVHDVFSNKDLLSFSGGNQGQ